jgi:hypothetical protein
LDQSRKMIPSLLSSGMGLAVLLRSSRILLGRRETQVDSAIITAIIGVVGAAVGGFIVLAGTFMTEKFQRQRDAITQTRELAENTC